LQRHQKFTLMCKPDAVLEKFSAIAPSL